MSKQLALAFFIEFALVFVTVFLLIQPRFAFATEARRARAMATISGYFLLCITFCWSVVVGCVLAIHQLTSFGI